MATRCDVCGEYPIRGAVRTFFPWPTDPSQRTYWQTCLGVQDLNLNKPELFICSDHFDQMQMIRKGTALRKDAFPKRYDGPLPTFLEEDGAPKVEPPSEDVKNEDVGIFDDPGPSAPVFDDEEIMPEELSMAKLVQMFAAAAKERPTTIAPFVTPISEETRAFSNILIDRQEKYLETYCKSCLRQAELVNMLEANCEGVPVTLMYKAVFMTEITPSDVPQLMCHTCIGLLFQCFKFSTMSARSCEVLQAARERFKYLSPLDDGTIDLKNIPDKYSAKPCPRPESDVEDQKDDVKVVKRSVKKRKSVVKSKEVPPEKKGRRTSTRRASEQAKKVSKKILEDSDEDDSNNDNFDNDEADPDFDAQEVKDESPEVSDAEVEEKEEDKDDQDPEDNYCMLCRHQFSNMARHMDKVHRVDWESKSCERCDWTAVTVTELFEHLTSDLHGDTTSSDGESLAEDPVDAPRDSYPIEFRVEKLSKKFKCQQCEVKSDSFKEMIRHFNQLHFGSLNCIFCSKRFETRISLLSHFKVHGRHLYCAQHFVAFDNSKSMLAHRSRLGHDLQCGICFKTFPSKAKRDSHRIYHLKKKKLTCSQCGCEYETFKDLFEHLQTDHKDTLNCILCKKSFKGNLQLLAHMKVHGQHLYCSQHFMAFDSKESMLDHRSRHGHDLQCGTFTCNQCGYEYEHFKQLFEHLQTEHKDTLNCILCEKSFKNPLKLLAHMKVHGQHLYCAQHFMAFDSKKDMLAHRGRPGHNVQCGICFKTFSSTEKRNNHRSSHFKISPNEVPTTFTCNQCGYEYEKFKQLFGHLQAEHKDTLNCILCERSFKTPMQLLAHMKVHGQHLYCSQHFMAFDTKESMLAHSGRPGHDVQCGICLKTFSSKENRNNHRRIHLKISKRKPKEIVKPSTFTCNQCGYKYDHFKQLFEHLQAEHKDTVNCILCEKSFKRPLQLLAHMKVHGKSLYCGQHYIAFESRMKFLSHCSARGHNAQCGICYKMLSSKNQRDSHKRIHLRNRPKQKGEYKCPQCPLVYGYTANLDRHIKTAHEKRLFLCEDCGSPFKTNFDLKRHISIKHKNDIIAEKQPFQCELCGKKFSISAHLKIHQANHLGHSDICDYCKDSFDSPEKLKEHVETLNHHTFQCHKCSANFRAKAHLINHLLKHDTMKKVKICYTPKLNKNRREVKYPKSEDGKYPCKICGKRLTSASNLMRHLDLHSDERKYKCDKCGKDFKQVVGLKNHMTVHSDERPYECPICGSRFKDSSTFCKHKKVHGESSLMARTSRSLKMKKTENRPEEANEVNRNEIQIERRDDENNESNIMGRIWLPQKLP